MFRKRKRIDDISLDELEHVLRLKRQQERQARFLRLADAGVAQDSALLSPDSASHESGLNEPPVASVPHQKVAPQLLQPTMKERKLGKGRETVLLLVELGAVVGLIIILVNSYFNLQELNSEVVEAQKLNLESLSSPDLEPLAANVVSPFTSEYSRLPGGHSSPTSAGGATPDVPLHLQNWVQPPPAVPLPKQESAQATRIVIPKINVDAPIIQGVGWEDLKKGVGHLPNSANPGERGNLYLAAHNDIYGEIFRYLEDLEPGDEYQIYAGEAKYTYIVREKRIIEPTEVSVMLPTTEPIATLQTCYPYLIDTHRLVVISDLVN